MPSLSNTALRGCACAIGLMLQVSPMRAETTQAVVQLGVYGEEAAAWADWHVMTRQAPQVADALEPQVITRDWVYRLIGVPRQGDARQGCEHLRRSGWQCFVTTQAPLPPVLPAPDENRPVPAPASAPAPATEFSAGLQLALYYSRDAAERGWQHLITRFPDLLGPVTPVYEQVNGYIALRAFAPSVAERDRLCLALRQQGAECLPLPGTQPEASDANLSTPSSRFGHGGVTTDYAPSPLGPDSILISTTDRKLLYQAGDGNLYVWPVAVGRHPSYHVFGDTEITVKRPHPTWTPPPEMRQRNPRLPRSMGPGPRNPLGAYALNLGFPYIRIHGTNQPQSVGRAASAGCYRMHADAIEFLFHAVSVGTPVRITQEPLEPRIQMTSTQ
jgi:lipoprotein-anchoring transpeptidase ErfK/SrfK